MTDSRISHGQIITLCGFTEEARQLAEKHGVGMVEEQDIARLFGSIDVDHRGRIQAVLNDSFAPTSLETIMKLNGLKEGLVAQWKVTKIQLEPLSKKITGVLFSRQWPSG